MMTVGSTMHEEENDISQQQHKNQKIIASFVVILVIVIIAVGITFFTNKKDSGTSDTASTSSNSTSSSANSTSTNSSSTYKDGTYTASGSYQTPGGQESIGVTLTIKGNVVTSTTLQQSANNRDTKEYQAQFASGYKSKVVGKALNSISLSRVSGSSLTSQGFNNALDQIKSQAAS